MKRIALPLALFFAALGFAQAQAELANFAQEGRATWGAMHGGMQASHPSLPIGSTPTVRCAATGREAVVTVTGRIPISTERVIDISADAALALGLDPLGGAVTVSFPSAASPAAQVQVSRDQEMPHGVSITIHNYVIPRSALPAWMEARAAGQAFPPPPPPPPAIRVIPAMPSPASSGLYRLRVGAWPSSAGAFAIFGQLRDFGMSAAQEYHHGEYRVYVSAMPAQAVPYAVSRLGGMGFAEVHVVETR